MSNPKASHEELRRYGYAPGNYTCVCRRCTKEFEGDKRAGCCLTCATAQYLANIDTPMTETVPDPEMTYGSSPVSIDSLKTLRNKIDSILDEETQRAADLVMAAIAILGEAKLMPQQSLGRGQFLFIVAPEVYDEIKKRSKDLPSKDQINGKPDL